MLGLLLNLISKFEGRVRDLNSSRHAGCYRTLKVIILGQQGLLIRHESLINFNLLATTDFDGLLNGEPPLEDIFKNILLEEGLSYDEKSPYIWLPDETVYDLIYKSDFIEIISPAPIFLIVSKAVKAPEKNKKLVLQAIEEYQDQILKLLEKYKVDISYFISE